MTHRVRHTALVALALILTLATPASADPPGPTDFKTVVTSISPSTDSFEIEIIGGDSFVLLKHLDDSTIDVLGYNGEPYLRFLPGGIVEQNRLSPATYLNEERFGDTIPDFADPTAAPEWEQIDDDGSFAWHDHRAHLMTDPPINTRPGDQVTDQVIPVLVDGEPIAIAVVSTWQTAPSSIPFAVGALAGVVAALVVWRNRTVVSAGLALAGVIALILGAIQYQSVPTETGPSITLIALPLVALAVAFGAVATKDRPATALPLAIGSAAALIAFAVLRLPGARKAILPTDFSMPLDRGLSTFVAVVGLGGLIAAGASFAHLMRGEPAG